jgi:flagellar biogenesis protein FliO
MFVQTIVNATTSAYYENEEIYNGTRTDSSFENIFKLRAPVVYKLEDMMMSLTLLLILSIVIFILYGFTRCFIYLAYHRSKKSIQNVEIMEEFV